jgi:ribosomal protein S18 acetylase RimI-like enzyme
VIIRTSTPADYPALADLWYDSWQSVGISNETDLSREGVRQRFYQEAADSWVLCVAERDGGRLGFLAMVPEEARIDQLFVDPALKGAGIGPALMTHAKSVMPEGIVLTTHETNLRARAFYERDGFVLTGIEPDAVHRRSKCHYVWRPGLSQL